jgi:hypothetical protein
VSLSPDAADVTSRARPRVTWRFLLVCALAAGGLGCQRGARSAEDVIPFSPPPPVEVSGFTWLDPLGVAPRTVECGTCLTDDTVLAEDLDCRGFEAGPALRICADGVALDCAGREIRGVPGGGQPLVAVENVRDAGVRDCRLVDGGVGLNASDVERLRVAANTIRGASSAAVVLNRVRQFRVVDNRVDGQGGTWGIEINSSHDGEVSRNVVANTKRGGLQFYGSDQIRVERNRVADVEDTCFGFFVDPLTGLATQRVEVRYNEAKSCRRVSANEIVGPVADLLFVGNQALDSRQGFVFYGERAPHDIWLTDNKVERGEIGIQLRDRTDRLVARGNTLRETVMAVRLEHAGRFVFVENRIEGRVPESTALGLWRADELTFRHNVITETTRSALTLGPPEGNWRLDEN